MRRQVAVAAVAGVTLLLAACARPTSATSDTGAGGTGAPAGPGASASAPAQASLVAVDGPGWSNAGLDGSVPPPGSCHLSKAADGQPLPDPSCTPGATDRRVEQSDLGTTICRPGGYSESVRPPEALTEAFKVKDLAAYGETSPLSSYELDHLVPLGLGGASDTSNLWPEPDDHPSGPYGPANGKDVVEDQLHDLVCAAVRGEPYVPVATAQVLIASDWTTALSRARAELVG